MGSNASIKKLNGQTITGFLSKLFIIAFFPTFIYVGAFYFLKNKVAEKIKKHEILLLGDSQTEYIQNPKIFNYSIQGSPYFIYAHFIDAFENDIKNKTVFVAFNYHHLSPLYQNRLEIDTIFPGWKTQMILENHLFESIQTRKDTLLSKFETDLPLINLKKLKTLYTRGNETNLHLNSINSIDSEGKINNFIYRHWYHPSYFAPDHIQMNYLLSNIEKLKKQQCRIIFIKMPLLNAYKSQIPEKYLDTYNQIQEQLKIPILDLDKELQISNNFEYFKDYGHLNVKGDSIVNEFLNQWLISNGL